MTKDPITAHATATVYDVLHAMTSEGVRHMPIVEGNELVGVVSERDLRSYSLALLEEPAEARSRLRTPVSRVMSSDVVTVQPDTDAGEIIDTLIENRIGAVPVVDPVEGDLVGIVSYVDVLRALRDRVAEL